MANNIKKTLDLDRLTVLIDTREQTPFDLKPMRMKSATLATGDYSLEGLEHHVAIERKSLPDLLACVGRERVRFDREIKRLLAYPVRCLIVESSWAEIEGGAWRSKVHPNAAIGSLLGWIAHGIPVVMAGDRTKAASYVQKILWIAANRRLKEAHSFLNCLRD